MRSAYKVSSHLWTVRLKTYLLLLGLAAFWIEPIHALDATVSALAFSQVGEPNTEVRGQTVDPRFVKTSSFRQLDTEANASYGFEDLPKRLTFEVQHQIRFRGSSVYAANTGFLLLTLREPASYRFEGSNAWTGAVAGTVSSYAEIYRAQEPEWNLTQQIYGEPESTVANTGSTSVQGIAEGSQIGQPATGNAAGFLEPGSYHIAYSFNIADYEALPANHTDMSGRLLFTLTGSTNGFAERLSEGVEFPVEFSGGSQPWLLTTNVTHDGVDAIQGGAYNINESSLLRSKVTGPGRLSFWWKLLGLTEDSSLSIQIDGIEQLRIDGEAAWQQRYLLLSPGEHEVEWIHSVGRFGSNPGNGAWLDQVSFESGELARISQTVHFDGPKSEPADRPMELSISASSFLRVASELVEGSAFLRENILIPTGTGSARVLVKQPGNLIFAPAEPLERTITLAPANPKSLAADTPQFTIKMDKLRGRWVHALAWQPDGKLIIGGFFNEVGGFKRYSIARLLADGSVDPSWTPMLGTNASVSALVVRGDHVFVGGSFDRAINGRVTHLAKISTTDEGSVDPEWDLHMNSNVTTMLEYGDSLILGGHFSFIGGVAITALAKVDIRGRPVVVPEWNPAPDNSVHKLAVYGTNLYVQGAFGSVGGLAKPGVAKVSLEGGGAADATWSPALEASSQVWDMVATDAGLYVGGLLLIRSEAGFSGIARLAHGDGRSLASVPTPYGTALVPQQGFIYAALMNSAEATDTYTSVRKLDAETLNAAPDWPQGGVRTALGSSTYRLDKFAFRGQDLWVGGTFSSFAGSSSSGLALLPTIEGAPGVTGARVAAGFQNGTGLVVTPFPADLIETTHYRISGIEHGALFKSDGTSRIQNGEFITKAQGAAGLRFQPELGFAGATQFEVQAAIAPHEIGAQGPKGIAEITVLGSRLSQTISPQLILPTPFTAGHVDLNFTASSGLPVEYAATGPVTLAGNRLTFTGVGEVTVVGQQPGNEIYAPTPPASVIFRIVSATQQIAFSPLSNAHYGETKALEANSSSGLPVNFSIVAGPAAIAEGRVQFTGVGLVTIRATQAGSELYEPTLADQTVLVSRATQAIAFPEIPSRPFTASPVALQATASSGLPVTFRVLSGPAKIEAGALAPLGAGQARVEAFQGGSDLYEPALAEQVVTFLKLPQSIDFPPIVPPLVTNLAGATNIEIALTATASSGLPAHFWVQSGPAGIVRNPDYTLVVSRPGTVTINAQQAGNDNYDASPVATQTFTILKLPQKIYFPTIQDTPRNSPPLPLEARASSGLPVQFRRVSGGASVSRGQLLFLGADLGLARVAADQSGDQYYEAASVTNVFTVLKAKQTIEFNPPATVWLTETLHLAATSAEGLPMRYAVVSGPAILVAPRSLRFERVGTVVIRAQQPGDTFTAAAEDVERTIEVVRTPQLITIPLLGPRPWNENPVQVNAVNSSALPLRYEVVSGPATMTGNLLTMRGGGEIRLRAFHEGTDLYAPGEAFASFTARPLAQTVQFAALPDVRVSERTVQLRATASSGLPVEFSVVGAAGLVTFDAATGLLTLRGTGRVTIQARQRGNADYLASGIAERFFTILKGTQTIEFPPVVSARVNQAIELVATASSGLPVQFGVLAGPAILSEGKWLTPVALGEVQLVAMQLGNTEYEAAPPVEQTIPIVKGTQTIQFAPPAEIQVKDGAVKLAATSSSGLPVRFAILSGPALLANDLLTPLSAGVVTIQAFQPGNDLYEAAPAIEKQILLSRKPPSLEILADGPGMTLRWDSFYSEFRLEDSPSLTAPVWTPSAGSPQAVDGVYVVRLPVAGEASYYRLAKPAP